jgi:hypothetical protein
MTANTSAGPQYQLSFGYDSRSRRIKKTVSINGTAIYTNRFVYDGWNLIAEVNPAKVATATYLWGNDLSGSMQGAGGVGGLLAENLKLGATTYSAIQTLERNFTANGDVAFGIYGGSVELGLGIYAEAKGLIK